MGIDIMGSTTGYGTVLDRAKKYLGMHEEGRMSNAALIGAEYAAARSVEKMAHAAGGVDWSFRWPWNSKGPASLPWDYPAIQKGELIRSFRTHVIGSGKAAWDAGGPEAPHAFWLEFGRHSGDYPMEPRPFMRNTIDEFHTDIQEQIRNYIKHGPMV